MKLIGSIPIGWHIKPIFALYERRTQRKHKDLPLLSVYRDYGVIPREDREDNFNRPSLDLSPYQLVENRDLVLNKMKTWQGSIAVSELRGIVSPAYIICRPRHGEHDRYMHYLLRAPSYITQYASLSYGVRVDQWDLRFEDFRRIQVLLPPVEDQRAIAAFLDCETRKIDALITKNEGLIELLQEKRIALITQAVTKGLDPNVPMKDSGVEWLGKIPAHWEVKRLRHIGMALIGLTYEPADVVGPDEGVLVLRASNVYDARIVLEDNVFVKRSIPDRLITKVGDILICARSGSRALIGKSAKIDKAFVDLTFGTFMIVFRSNYNDYLFYAFNSTLFNYQSGAFLTSTINQLTLSNLNSFTVPVPPAPEQEAIAVFLDRETAKIDALVKKVQEAVQRLKEYRTALISAAVTGKIDVRDEVRW